MHILILDVLPSFFHHATIVSLKFIVSKGLNLSQFYCLHEYISLLFLIFYYQKTDPHLRNSAAINTSRSASPRLCGYIDKTKRKSFKAENTKEDSKKVKFDDWEKFTSYCIKCGKRKKIHNGRCDIGVYHLRDKKFIPICSECFAKLPEIPDGYLDELP